MVRTATFFFIDIIFDKYMNNREIPTVSMFNRPQLGIFQQKKFLSILVKSYLGLHVWSSSAKCQYRTGAEPVMLHALPYL